MEQYGGLVWSLVRARVRNAADAEDATQEIFIDVWKSAARFDSQVGSEAVFIATIARRRLVDRLRAQGRRPVTEEFDEQVPLGPVDQNDAYADATDLRLAAQAVAELDGPQREVLLLGIVQGLTHSEIADFTGKPLGTVKTLLRRGLVKIRDLIERDALRARTGVGS
jgi:RNA polymerase sigma-70 factor (ECF subfamily)